MPRLPVVLATEGISAPQSPRFPERYGSDVVGAEILRAGQNVSGALSAVGVQRQREANQEAALLASNAEMQIGVADASLRASQRDPEGYQTDYEKLLQQTVSDVSAGAKNPQAAALMRQHLEPVLNKNRVAAAQHVESLRTDQGLAQLDATLDNRKTLAGLAVSDTEFQRQYTEGENAIKVAPRISADKKGDMLRKFREDVLGGKALQEANEQPEVFAATADVRYAMLDKKRREELKAHANARAEQYRKERLHIAEGAQKDLEEVYKRDVRSLTADFDKRAAEAKTDDERAGILRDLNLRIELRQVEGEDARRIRSALETPRDTPSDAALLTDASVRANRATPVISESELDRLRLAHQNGGKGLNQKDYMELKSKVIGRADHLKAEGLTEQGKRHTQAEQVLGRALGISSLYDKIDEQDKQLYDMGLRELTARSNAFDGREDPIAVVNEIVNRDAPIRQERLKLKAQQISRTMIPSVSAQTADEASARLEALRPTMPPAQYEQERRKVLDMKRAEVSGAVNEAKRQGESSAGKNPLRKPGQTPQAGKAD